MGDRALVQFKDKGGFSPALYTHWGGENVMDVIRETYEEARKYGNRTECAVVFSTFVKNMYATGAESFALYNLDGLLREENSCGDFGCAIVDTDTGICDVHGDPVWRIYAGGGYGEQDGDTFPLDEVPPVPSLVVHGYQVTSPVTEEFMGRLILLEKIANSMLNEMTQSVNKYKEALAGFKKQIVEVLEDVPPQTQNDEEITKKTSNYSRPKG